MIPVEEQLARIRRGCDSIVPEDELRKKLERSRATGKPLRVKPQGRLSAGQPVRVMAKAIVTQSI